MSKYYVTPNLSSDDPIGQLTGYRFEVAGASASREGLLVAVSASLRVDGQVQDEFDYSVKLEPPLLPEGATLSEQVLIDQSRFFLETVEQLVNTGMPVRLLEYLLGVVDIMTGTAPLSYVSETDEPYRCVEFRYEERAVSRAVFAKAEQTSASFVILNGEFSEWQDPVIVGG